MSIGNASIQSGGGYTHWIGILILPMYMWDIRTCKRKSKYILAFIFLNK